MRIQRDDDDDIRRLVERGSSTWVGPSPSARQSRWAADDKPRRRMSVGLAAAGFGVAALLTGSLALVGTSRSPDGAASSVMRLVSHVFSTPATVTPAPSPPVSAPPAPAAAPTPTGARPATARPSQRPSPEPSATGAGYRRPSPSPSTSGGPAPSPSPTDE